MKYLILFLFFIYTTAFSDIKNLEDDYFFVGKMESYNKDFTLYFKTREKAILSRGEDFNYITDYPQDLYIYNHKLKTDEPLITYEWFPSYVKKISERHRHRYEVNNRYRKILEKFGLVISGVNDSLGVVESIEISNHPWFVAGQFHPELKSRVNKAHPLFRNFIKAATVYNQGRS